MATVLLALLVLTGCGGDDDNDGAASATTADASSEDGGAAGLFTSARCAEAVQAMAKAASIVPQAFTGAAADLESPVDQLKTFADGAPAEIRDELRTVYEGYARFVEVLQDANFDASSGQQPPPEVLEKLQEAGDEVNTEEFREASERVQAWFQNECGR